MAQRARRNLARQLGCIGDLSKGLRRRVELEQTPVLMRMDASYVRPNAFVRIVPGPGP